jgi:hypothetical protein
MRRALTSKGREAAKVGVVVALLLISILVGACGSSSGGGSGATSTAKKGRLEEPTEDAPRGKPHSKLVQWALGATPRGRQVKIEVTVGYCGSGKKPVISNAHVEEKAKEVLIGAIVTEFGRPGPCAGVEIGLSKTVTLPRPLGRRALYDASENPPAKRWPRG